MKFTFLNPNLIKPLEQSLNQLFTNKYFLYFILFLSAVINLGYLLTNNIDAVGFFVAVGIIAMNFSKNMSIILTISLVATKILFANKTQEGMETKSEETTATTIDKKDKGVQKDKGNKGDKKNLEYRAPNEHVIITPPHDDTANTSDSTDVGQEETTDEASGFKPMNSEDGIGNKKNKLDYGASITKAYSNLNAFLDPEGIKHLTQDTSELMEQQNKLYSSMNSMTPLLSQAKSLLNGFDMAQLNGAAGIK